MRLRYIRTLTYAVVFVAVVALVVAVQPVGRPAVADGTDADPALFEDGAVASFSSDDGAPPPPEPDGDGGGGGPPDN